MRVNVLAKKSEYLFREVARIAEGAKMKVNKRKTQMLCIHAKRSVDVTSFIRLDISNGEKITSTDTLKILGFTFNHEPNASAHVKLLIDKFYSKLWILRFLKRSGMEQSDLLKVYYTVIRPCAEYSSIVYNTLIPQYLANKLELMQKQAIKIIYGYNINYGNILEIKGIETLAERRTKSSLSFAINNKDKDRFKKWFPLAPNERTNVRGTTHRKYLEKQTRTERTKNNPLQNMIRLLNEHEQK